ncbi:MAG TPA: hypothetical protein VGS02_03050 [Acidobacteriaceae bacterium]|nr:hypothetical protein [Acidobacteriaceae bacterium]
MGGVWTKLVERLPLQFRVLYRQFLLQVIDLEALSIEADIPRFLGQFAGVLILITIFQTIQCLFAAGNPKQPPWVVANLALQKEQSFIAGTMLIAGLIAVVSWDGVFPDRRDAMVLGPLPVKPQTILAAKLAASGALLAVGVVALNFSTGTVLPWVMGGSLFGFLRALFSWWFTMAAATAFLYGAVLTVQGWSALLLSRPAFLRVSALLQLAAFALFLMGWIFQPSFPGLHAMSIAGRFAGKWPACWFLCVFQQLDGTLPSELAWMAHRAWVAVGVSVAGAGTSLLLCYFRTMKKTVEQPDLVPGGSGRRLPTHWGNSLETAIVQFCIRSLARSKQHRVIYAFYLAISFAIAVSTIESVVQTRAARPVTPEFLMPTMLMLCLAIAGLRSIFSLPVSLKANWVLQVTQLRPPEQYIAATRRALLVMSAIPVWLVVAGLSLCFRPWHAVAEHLIFLALLAWLLTELSMLNVSKIPFACSFLPGKMNIQYLFWALAVVFIPIAMTLAHEEIIAFGNTRLMAALLAVPAIFAAGLCVWNRHEARSAVLYYEEQEPEVVMRLGLAGAILQPREATSSLGEGGSQNA